MALVCGFYATVAAADTDPNVQIVAVDASNRDAAEALNAKLGVAQRGGTTYLLTDLVAMMHFADGELEKLAVAYPNPFTVACDTGLCSSTSSGAPARGRTISNDPALNDVDLGVTNAIASHFLVADAVTCA